MALFDRMSVLDNVKVGCHSRSSTGFLDNALRLPKVAPEEAHIAQRAQELIAFMDLMPYGASPAGCRSRSASASNSRARSPRAPSCCCSTSRRPASTTKRSTYCKGQIKRVRFYANFETGRAFPILHSHEATLLGFEKMQRMASAPNAIIPGHDPLVTARYPAAAPGLEGIALRLDVEPNRMSEAAAAFSCRGSGRWNW